MARVRYDPSLFDTAPPAAPVARGRVKYDPTLFAPEPPPEPPPPRRGFADTTMELAKANLERQAGGVLQAAGEAPIAARERLGRLARPPLMAAKATPRERIESALELANPLTYARAAQDVASVAAGEVMPQQFANVAEAGRNVADLGTATAQAAQASAEPSPESIFDDLSASGRYIAQQGLANAPTTLGALVMRRGGLPVMGTLAGGAKYADVRQEGGTASEAQGAGVVSGAVEGLTERIPFDVALGRAKSTIQSMLGERAAKVFQDNLVGRMAASGVTEATQEMVAEATGIAYDVAELGKDIPLDQVGQRLRDSGLIGAAIGQPMAVVGYGLERGQRQAADTAKLDRDAAAIQAQQAARRTTAAAVQAGEAVSGQPASPAVAAGAAAADAALQQASADAEAAYQDEMGSLREALARLEAEAAPAQPAAPEPAAKPSPPPAPEPSPEPAGAATEPFEAVAADLGMTPEQHAAASAQTDDIVPQPAEDAGKVQVGPSAIQGDGVLAARPLAAGEAVTVLEGENRTPAGRYVNHADQPTAEFQTDEQGRTQAVATAPIPAGGEVTVDYRADPRLQNRDRTRAASVAQMTDIANNPDPDRLGFAKTPESGAPMVSVAGNADVIEDADMGIESVVTMANGMKVPVRYAVVEADSVLASNDVTGATNPDYTGPRTPGQIRALNNGRVAGIQAAHQRGTVDTYIDGLIQAGREHGVAAEAIRSKRRPMLVRVYDETLNVEDMGRLSNAGGGMNLSAAEMAENDARALGSLDDFAPGPNGEVITAQNMPFVRRFIQSVPENERADLMDAQGRPSKQLTDRLEAAVFAKAYAEPELTAMFAEAANPDTRNVLNALTYAAADFARVDKQGLLGGLPQKIGRATQVLRDARARGMTVQQLIDQADMFDRDSAVESVALFMSENMKSHGRMGEALREMARFIVNEQTRAGSAAGDMFGAAPPSFDDAISRVNSYLTEKYGDKAKQLQPAAGLFGAGGKPTAAAAGRDAGADARATALGDGGGEPSQVVGTAAQGAATSAAETNVARPQDAPWRAATGAVAATGTAAAADQPSAETGTTAPDAGQAPLTEDEPPGPPLVHGYGRRRAPMPLRTTKPGEAGYVEPTQPKPAADEKKPKKSQTAAPATARAATVTVSPTRANGSKLADLEIDVEVDTDAGKKQRRVKAYPVLQRAVQRLRNLNSILECVQR